MIRGSSFRNRALSDSSLQGAVQQAGRSHALRISRKGASRTPPPQLLHLAEKWRVGPKRRQILEEERQIAAIPQYGRRELLDDSVAIQQPCRRRHAYPR